MTERPIERRRALGLIAGAGAGLLAACAGGKNAATGTTSTTSTTSTASTTKATNSSSTNASTGATDPIPEETQGPFPGDGSNGPNVLGQDGVVRSDIRSSFGSASGTAAGVPLTINMTVRDAATGLALPGAAVYVWHCDREGRYSLYSNGVTGANYLRGVQEADGSGAVSFESIFPGAYSGRLPHVHFEVYSSTSKATNGSSAMATSQIAMPKDACDSAYASTGYEDSVGNLAQTSLATDMVFRDGWDQELGTVTGSADNGFTVSLDVPV
jgi:protocatechuate 3,4-dioxygenase beta subunit